MVQLVIIYCLVSAPLSCIEKRPMPEVPFTTTECIMAAQPIAADFLREHPAYALNSFRCEIDKRDERQS